LGNKLFVASVDGRVCAVDLATGTKLWDKLFNDEKFYGGFAIDVNGNLYIAGKRLWCLKSSDGSVNWSYELDDQAYANPVISSNGVIYIGIGDTSGTFGTLHAVDLNGSRRWKKTGLRSIFSSAVIGNNGIVYVCSDWIHAINPYDGSIISSLELQNFVESNPILHFGKIYVADEAGYFYVIRALSETIEDLGTSWPMFQRDWYHTATR
jgi:outer membrane protein assembly factor BamB